MNILEVLNSYPGETFIQEHARAIIENTDIELSWAFWQSSQPGKLKNAVPGLKNCVGLINPNRISKIKKAFIRLRYFNYADPYTQALKDQVKKIKPDIIHFHFASLATRQYTWVAAMGIPFTFSVRGADIQSEVICSADTLDVLKIITKKAVGIHTVCEHLKDELFRYCGENKKTTTIRTVINEHWKTIERNPVKGHLVSIGRLHWRKNYADLILASHAVKKRGGELKLTIIGEGEQRTILEYMIRDLDLGEVVKLVGKQDAASIKACFSNADAFVLSSIAEGFPNVVGEAAFAKVPIIATEDSYITEVFDRDKEVSIATTGSSESLASKIEELLRMDDDTRNMRTRESLEKANVIFSSNRHANEFNLFWTTLIGHKVTEWKKIF